MTSKSHEIPMFFPMFVAYFFPLIPCVRNANYATEEVYISIEVRCETQPEERVAISGCAAEGAGLVGVTWVSRVRAVETEKWLGDVVFLWIPSGKHTHNYGKSQFLMGKSTISTGPCSIAILT